MEKYIVGEQWEYVWDLDDVKDFDQRWNEEGIRDVRWYAEYFGVSAVEVALLIMDRAEKQEDMIISSGMKPPKENKKPKQQKYGTDRERVRVMYLSGVTAETIAQHFGVSRRQITRIITQERSKHPDRWERKKTSANR